MYRRYMVSFIGSGLGFQSMQVVTGWLAFEISDSVFVLALVLFVSGVAQTVAAPLGGVLADRLDRKKQMIAMQSTILATALVMGGIAVVGTVELWHLFISAGVFGFAMSVHMPARQAFVYNIVGKEHIANGMAINAGAMSTMRLAGPGIGGVLIGAAGPEWVYFLAGAGYAASVAILLFVLHPQEEDRPINQEPFLDSFRDGIAYVRRNTVVS